MAKEKPVAALVLTDCTYGKCLDVVILSVEEVQAGFEAGVLDPTPESVAVGKIAGR